MSVRESRFVRKRDGVSGSAPHPAKDRAPHPATVPALIAWLALFATATNAAVPPPGTGTPDASTRARVVAGYGQMPLAFEANQGQTDAQVQFLARGQGYGLFLTDGEAVLSLHAAAPQDPAGKFSGRPERSAAKSKDAHVGATESATAVVRMRLLGANTHASATGLDPLPGTSNYFTGNDPAKWHSNIANYARVKYAEVYPGIDLVYYGNQRQLEYDFVLAPGADPNVIKLDFSGVEKVELDADGNLLLRTPAGNLVQHKPVVYQQIDGERREVEGRYAVHGKRAQFRLASYDKQQALTIDPVLGYSTYLGGNSSDIGLGVAVDGSGNAYITGQTQSTNFPTASALQVNNAGGFCDGFVVKLNAAGTLAYSTYLGGNSSDLGTAIAVDTNGNAYVTGYTYSTNFPTTASALQPTFAGNSDAFVVKLNAAGALAYSTFLGNSSTHGSGIAVDASGGAYITGDTDSIAFPTAFALQANNAGGIDAFVVKANAAGSLVYSTYLGGSGNDYGSGIAVDGSGNAHITGFTTSTNFPTTSALQMNNAGGSDAFVTKLNVTGTALVYSTYLGGSNNDFGNGIAIDGSGNAYLTGNTQSTNFPIASALQANLEGTSDAIVAKLNTSGALVYSTYLGGSNNDFGYGIAVDGSGNAYVTGPTRSTNFPTTSPLQAALDGTSDAFVTKLNAAGMLAWSTYLGGGGLDSGDAIAVDGGGNAYVAGQTTSINFPTVSPLQPTNAGTNDAFVVKVVPTHTIGGTVTGLSGASMDMGLILSLNAGAQSLHVAANGSFVFATPLPSGAAYAVTVSTQPTYGSQTCVVTNDSGTVTTANITNVVVTCVTNTYGIGGTVSGLLGGGLELSLNNGAQTQVIDSDGPFDFPSGLPSGSTYAVTVSQQPFDPPPPQTCTVSNGSGTVTNADIVDIEVTCVTDSHSVGGTISGLSGSGLVLELNGGAQTLAVTSGATGFTFPTTLSYGSTFNVTVQTQPGNPLQNCTVSNGSGTLYVTDITNISVTCVTPQALLSLSLDDGHDYARYGMTLDYVITLYNSGAATANVSVIGSTPGVGFDMANAHWQCIPGGDGATCTVAGSGPFSDSATIPPQLNVAWIVSIPVLSVTNDNTVQLDVGTTASNANSVNASDIDNLVIFRDGFNVLYGDGTRAQNPAPDSVEIRGGDASVIFALPPISGSRIEAVKTLRSGDTEIHVDRLRLGARDYVRLRAHPRAGVERTSLWAQVRADALLAIGVAGDERTALLEGAEQPLALTLGD